MTNDLSTDTSPADENSPQVEPAGPSPLGDSLVDSAISGHPGKSVRNALSHRPGGSSRRKLPSPSGGPLKKILLFLGLAVIFYSLAVFFLAPYLLTNTLPTFLAKKLNRPVTIGSAQVNPYTLNITLKNGIIGPDLADADDKVDPVFSFGRLEGRINPAFVFKQGHLFKAIRGNSLFVHLSRQKDGSLNFTGLLARLIVSDTTAHIAHLADLMQAGDINLTNSRLIYSDLASASQHTLEEISFSLPKRDKGSATISPHFSAIIDGSPISVGGQSESSASGQNTRLTFTLEQINLADYLAYLPHPFPGLITKGEADMELLVDYRISPDKTSHLEINGSGVARDIWLYSPEKGENKIAVANFSLRFDPLNSQLTINKLTLEHPEIQLQRSKDGSYIFPGTPHTEAPEGAPPINLATLVVKNGRLSYIDQNVKGGFGAIFNDINLSMDRGNGEDSRHAYALNCVTSRQTRIASQGHISLAKGKVDGLLILHNLPMTALNTYMPPGPGVTLSSGIIDKAEATLQLSLQGRHNNSFTLSKLKGSTTNLDIYHQGKEWLHIDKGTFTDATFASAPSQISLGQMTLSGLLGHFSPTNTRFLAKLLYQEKEPGPGCFTGLNIKNGTLLLRDFSFQKNPEIPLKIVNLDASGFGKNGKSKGKIDSSFTLPEKGKCQLQGELSLAPLTGSLHLTMEHIALNIFTAKQMAWFAPEVHGGALDFSGKFTLADLVFDGHASLSDFRARAHATQDKLITLQKGSTQQIHLGLKPFSLAMDSVDLEGLELFATLSRDDDSLTSLFFSPEQSAKITQGNIAVNKINLTTSSLHFSDKTLKPPFTKSLTAIQGSLTDLTNRPGNSLKLKITGQTDDQATLNSEGAINLFDESFGANLNVSLVDQPLAPFIPYLEPMVGHSLSGGIFNLSVLYRETAGKVNADTVLTLRHLTLGDKDLGNKQFPTSLALVTDNEHIISLDIPVVGDMTDPSYTFHSAYGKKLRNLISKASVSPFSMLTEHYDPGQPAPDHVLFTLGTAEPTAESNANLQAIEKILANRPLLTVTLKGYSAGSEDRDALLQKKREEDEKKRLALQKSLSSDLVDSYGKEEIVTPPAMAPGESTAILTVSKEELLTLAHERCLRIRELLIEQYGVDADRIHISPDTSVVPESGAGLAGNRADFILGRTAHEAQ